jgi:two-component system, OmpR family, response regulator ChvI
VQFVYSAEHTLNTSMKKRILLVDDEVDITTTYRMALEEAGFQVDAYNDSSLALSEYKPSMYDLLLLDVKMPKMNGFELYEKIKGSKTDQKPKVCFITAFEVYYQSLKELFPKDDVDCFLSKPISLDELVKTVKSELGLL